MATAKELVNPYGSNSKCRDFFQLLQEGPKTAQQLIDTGIVKHPRRIRELATILNMMDGIRVRCEYKKDVFDLEGIWSINVTSSSCPLLMGRDHEGEKKGTEKAAPAIPAKIGRYIPHPKFPRALVSVKEGNNIFLWGPPGTGKTEMALQLAKFDERIFIRQNFHREISMDELIGRVEITTEGGVSVTTWKDEELAKACRLAASGRKVLYIADEITAAPAETLFKFHRLLERAKDGHREIEINGETLIIPAGNLTIVATSNTFRMDETGENQGTQSMNLAFCDRWTGGVFFVDYSPAEADILEACGVDARLSKALVHMGREIRRKAVEERLSVQCSTRKLIAIGLKAKQWGIQGAIEDVFLATLLSDEREKVVDPVIRTITFPA